VLKSEGLQQVTGLDDLLGSELIARVGRLDIASRKVFAGKLKGERRSKKRGESVEFADHRPYVMGDDLRHIDWNIYGRLDRLFMKLFVEEEDLSLWLVADASASMGTGDPSKFRFVQRACAALGYIGLVNYNRVTLAAIAERAATEDGDPESVGGVCSTLRNLRGRRRIHEMGTWLCNLEPGGTTNFPEACKRLALSRQGRGVMVLFSDFFLKEGYEQGLRYLIGRGYDVIIIQVLSPQEVLPELGGDLRLKDLEDGDTAEITISGPLLKRYKANLASYIDEIRSYCARREITHMVITSDTDIEALLLDYLRVRGVVKGAGGGGL